MPASDAASREEAPPAVQSAAVGPQAVAQPVLQPPVLQPPVLQPGRRYRPGRGFTYRRESFGGILYHYEGVQPDPRVTFVDNAFLIDLLDAVTGHPDVPLDALAQGVQAHFGLDGAERRRMDAFFATLIARGALVPD